MHTLLLSTTGVFSTHEPPCALRRQPAALKAGGDFARKMEAFKPELAKRVEMVLALADAVVEGAPPPTVTSDADRVPMGARVAPTGPLGMHPSCAAPALSLVLRLLFLRFYTSSPL